MYHSSVCNISHATFIAHLFHIPLKTSIDDKKGFTEQELYYDFAASFATIFLDVDPVKSFGLRATAAQGVQKISPVVRDVCKAVKADHLAKSLKDFLGLGDKEQILRDYGTHMIQRLFEGGKSVDEVVSNVMATATAGVANQAQCVGTHIYRQYPSIFTLIPADIHVSLHNC